MPRNRSLRRAVVLMVAAVAAFGPALAVTAPGSAASEDSSYLAFGPPAVGSNGVYSDAVTFPAHYDVPAVTAGGSPVDATYAIAGSNTAGCSISSSGAGFSYAGVGTCTITVSAQVDADDNSNGGNSQGHEGSDQDGVTATASLTLTVAPGPQSIAAVPASGPVGTPLTMAASGYSGTGAITFDVTSGGTATGCQVTTPNVLTSTGAGTCLVTASIAAP